MQLTMKSALERTFPDKDISDKPDFIFVKACSIAILYKRISESL